MTSKKTTIAGILGFLAILLTQVYYAVDADVATDFSLTAVLEGLSLLGIGLFARDNSVTSESAGAV